MVFGAEPSTDPGEQVRHIARYRRSLERDGVDTDTWWDRQLGLCLLAMAATMGWEKAVGDADELAWWSDRAQEAAAQWL